jgi:hypothetical protein
MRTERSGLFEFLTKFRQERSRRWRQLRRGSYGSETTKEQDIEHSDDLGLRTPVKPLTSSCRHPVLLSQAHPWRQLCDLCCWSSLGPPCIVS